MHSSIIILVVSFLVQTAFGLFSDYQYLDATDCTELGFDVKQIYRRTDPNYL